MGWIKPPVPFIDPASSLGAASQFDSLRSLRMTHKGEKCTTGSIQDTEIFEIFRFRVCETRCVTPRGIFENGISVF